MIDLTPEAAVLLTGEGLPAALGQAVPEFVAAGMRTPIAVLPEPQRPSYLPVEGKPW